MPQQHVRKPSQLAGRMSENAAVETDSGKLHFVTHWGLEEDSAEGDWTIFP